MVTATFVLNTASHREATTSHASWLLPRTGFRIGTSNMTSVKLPLVQAWRRKAHSVISSLIALYFLGFTSVHLFPLLALLLCPFSDSSAALDGLLSEKQNATHLTTGCTSLEVLRFGFNTRTFRSTENISSCTCSSQQISAFTPCISALLKSYHLNFVSNSTAVLWSMLSYTFLRFCLWTQSWEVSR